MSADTTPRRIRAHVRIPIDGSPADPLDRCPEPQVEGHLLEPNPGPRAYSPTYDEPRTSGRNPRHCPEPERYFGGAVPTRDEVRALKRARRHGKLLALGYGLEIVGALLASLASGPLAVVGWALLAAGFGLIVFILRSTRAALAAALVFAMLPGCAYGPSPCYGFAREGVTAEQFRADLQAAQVEALLETSGPTRNSIVLRNMKRRGYALLEPGSPPGPFVWSPPR